MVALLIITYILSLWEWYPILGNDTLYFLDSALERRSLLTTGCPNQKAKGHVNLIMKKIFYHHNFRCQIPVLTNDSFAAQGPQHMALINKYIPVDKDGNYDQCSFYDINQSTTKFDNNSRPINASKIKCSSWVYSKDVFHDTFVTKVNVRQDVSKTLF
jgi:hypothetical protein